MSQSSAGVSFFAIISGQSLKSAHFKWTALNDKENYNTYKCKNPYKTSHRTWFFIKEEIFSPRLFPLQSHTWATLTWLSAMVWAYLKPLRLTTWTILPFMWHCLLSGSVSLNIFIPKLQSLFHLCEFSLIPFFDSSTVNLCLRIFPLAVPHLRFHINLLGQTHTWPLEQIQNPGCCTNTGCGFWTPIPFQPMY